LRKRQRGMMLPLYLREIAKCKVPEFPRQQLCPAKNFFIDADQAGR
jgi:hypothetical protein